jgi:hypothetical protein
MAETCPDEVRVRVTVDSDTPELLKRLAGSKRQAREIVYLLRLGMQMEMMLSGKVPMVGVAADGQAIGVSQVAAAVASDPVKSTLQLVAADMPTGAALAALTGLDADYFSGAPTGYAE